MKSHLPISALYFWLLTLAALRTNSQLVGKSKIRDGKLRSIMIGLILLSSMIPVWIFAKRKGGMK